MAEVKVIKKEEKAAAPVANVAFVGADPWKPLVSVQTATGHFTLPEDQSKPFYSEKAGFLIRTYPHLYKPAKPKGDK